MRILFRVLLHLYPRPFRARFGREVVEQGMRECTKARERGVAAGLLCVAATCLDMARSGLAERWSPTWNGDDEQGRTNPMNPRGARTMTGRWIRDLRHAARALGRSPGFTAAATGTLALALGANAAIFAVVDAVLLEPPPYDDPDRLVYIGASAPGTDFPDEFGVSPEFYLQYSAGSEQLESLAIFNSFTTTIRSGDRAERLRISMATPSLFRTLGVDPAVGRVPEESEGDGRVAVLGHGFWTTWFGGDPSVIGRTIEINGEEREIIGVMGPGFRFPPREGEIAAWVPVEPRLEDLEVGRFGLPLVGRLAPGGDPTSLERELSTLASRIPELYGGPPAYARLIERHEPVVRPLEEWLVGPVSTALGVLMASVGIVLLIACANVANLFTVRTQGRGGDLAVRRAMGAGRGDLIRSQLSEAALVATLAGLAALALAGLTLPTLIGAAPDGVPRIDDAHLSTATMAFTAASSALAALLCGLGPALRGSSPELARLRGGSRGSTGRRPWGRHALVVCQTALTLVLLIGSGLLLRSFQELRSRDPGYDTRDILTFQFAPEQAHLVDGPSWARFHLDFMDRLRSLPGVEAVGIVDNVPLNESLREAAFVTGETPTVDPSEGAQIGFTFAGGDYFEAMGIELLRGRAFTEEDARVPGRVVVSQAAAELLWPGADPVGRRLRNTLLDEWHTVVGVVEDIVQYDLGDPPDPVVYYPMVGPAPDSWTLTSPGYVVRASRAGRMTPEVRELVAEVAPSAPVYRVHTMNELVSSSMVRLSFTMFTLAVAAGLALLLGTVGLYAVLSHVVTDRTREIGVRMALGAERSRVRMLVVGQGARVLGLGIVLGLAVALVASRTLESLLYGVAAVDAWTFGVTSLVLAAAGLLACYLPARRASRVDPVQSMRVG